MKFEKIAGASGTIKELGVEWTDTHIHYDPYARIYIGENQMHSLASKLSTYNGPLYRGNDGNLYIVEYVNVSDIMIPACWMPVKLVSRNDPTIYWAISVAERGFMSYYNTGELYGEFSLETSTNVFAVKTFSTEEEARSTMNEIVYFSNGKVRPDELEVCLWLYNP